MTTSCLIAAVLAVRIEAPTTASQPVSEGTATAHPVKDPGVVMSVTDFGAKGDARTDDTASIRAAAQAAAGGTLRFPSRSGAYKISDTITVPGNTRVAGENSRILMALPVDHPIGQLFHAAADNVHFEGLWIDASGADPRATGNRYAIRIVGTANQHLQNIVVRNCRFTNLPWAEAKAVLATHAVYNKWADFTTVENSLFDAVSGAAVFVSQSNGIRIVNNDIRNTGWYSIQLQDHVDGALVSGNRLTGTVPGGRMWGGSVNLMSNGKDLGAGKARDKHVLIADNYISGVHSYTAAIQIESSSYVSFVHNTMEGISLSSGAPPTYVRIYTRPQGNETDEGPSDNIDVSANTLTAKGPDCIGIYADNQRFGGQTGYSSELSVRNNTIVSPDANNTFSHAVIVNGQAGGWRDVEITGNKASGRPLTTPQSGLIGVVGRSSSPVKDVLISDNSLQFVGKATNSAHLGIAIEAYVDHAIVRANELRGFWHGIRIFPNSHFIELAPSNKFSDILNASLLGAQEPPKTAVATFIPAVQHFSIDDAERSKDGTDAIMGTATLVSGTVSIKTKNVTANSRILLSEISKDASPADLRVSARTPGMSFTISSSITSDTSRIAWLIVEPDP